MSWNTAREDLEFFNDRIEKTVLATLEHVSESEFGHVTYTDAIEELKKAGRAWGSRSSGATILQADTSASWRKKIQQPLIVYDYPAKIKPFYMRVNDDGQTVRAMDVLVPGVGEIIGGSQREERLDVLDADWPSKASIEKPIGGISTCAVSAPRPCGFGLGLERMVHYLTGMDNIRDVIPFPRTPGNAEF